MSPVEPMMPQPSLEDRRTAARRTAVVLGLVALAIFIAFLVNGMTGAA